MAVSANRCGSVAARDRLGVDAFAVRQKWSIADATSSHHRFVTMTATTGFGNVCPINCGSRLSCGLYRRGVAIPGMTIQAGRGFRAVLNGPRVKAALVISMWSGVETRAAEIWKVLAWAMTSLAGKRRGRRRGLSGLCVGGVKCAERHDPTKKHKYLC
jgi:hypothetical protein